jgi:hypothetical protein
VHYVASHLTGVSETFNSSTGCHRFLVTSRELRVSPSLVRLPQFLPLLEVNTSTSDQELIKGRNLGDLRQRHRRRCEKSLKKSRAPKKKSCTSCARSKAKCDLIVPACKRCMDRHTTCTYPIDSSTALAAHFDEDQAISAPSHVDSYTTSPTAFAPTDAQLENNQLGTLQDGMRDGMRRSQTAAGDIMPMDWCNGLDDGSTMNFWSSSAWNTASVDMEAPCMNTAAEKPSSTSHGDSSWLLQNTDSGGQFPDFGFFGTTHGLGNIDGVTFHERSLSPTAATRLSATPVVEASAVRINAKKDGIGGPLEKTTSVIAPSHEPPSISAGMSDPPSTNRSKVSTSSSPAAGNVPSPLEGSRRGLSWASNGHSSTTNSRRDLSTSPPSSCSGLLQKSGLFDVEIITDVICEYPKQLLRQNFWSPFVHHRHYRCSQGGLAEPVAIALCCVSANQQCVESSFPFVCKMINNERERLVNEFPTKSENLEEALTVLHAMCIYQIETILALRLQRPVKQQISSAELYHHFLLKMTRRLCQEHIEGLSLKDNHAIHWQRWTMAETLRRTTYLVNMVNELSYHTNALKSVYHESLDDPLLLNMPLPAPESSKSLLLIQDSLS